jgi:hypothetical protein
VTETPAETIRHAAKLMRERAEAATPSPWCWEATGDKDSSWAAGLVHDEDGNPLTGEIDKGEGSIIDGVCESIDGNPGDGAHIASWHPGVALAVADWLDEAAGAYEAFAGAAPGHSLKVARAYLGEAEA